MSSNELLFCNFDNNKRKLDFTGILDIVNVIVLYHVNEINLLAYYTSLLILSGRIGVEGVNAVTLIGVSHRFTVV